VGVGALIIIIATSHSFAAIVLQRCAPRSLRIWGDDHERSCLRVTQTNCTRKRADVEVDEAGFWSDNRLRVEASWLFVQKEDVAFPDRNQHEEIRQVAIKREGKYRCAEL
jgi:hypothetical protein